ncbi:M16 family metallopeptidase [Streptomyces sp. NPDC090022]|uniref:M16 family metallopeptidase n=1 Tax=Streptomyces sp. NPDC090022 TaxID=3365920 RepID=UPI0037FC37C2
MITETTVDGVRTVLAHRAGPVTAGLLFRVGRADESLATSGVTHLVEHLALHRHGLSDLHYNGATAAAYTHFHVTGTPADVVEYLNGVCAALRDLPMERLETEKEILRTEGAGRGRGPGHALPLWRYGSRSYGLTSYGETGLHRLTGHAVRAWAQEWFTRENAVLWMTTDTLPEGLDLTLPSGTWRPAPAPTSALPQTPAYFHGDDGGVVLSSVLPRSTRANLFTEVLGKELFRELRQKGGYSYTAAADYCVRDADHATVLAYADALPEKQGAVVGAFIDVLAKLRAGRIEQADLDAVRASALSHLDAPDLAAAMLPSHAMNLLLGHRNLTEEQARAEIAAVTVADLRQVARELWANALLQVPGRGVEWAGVAAAPQESADIVTGRRYTSLEDREVALLVGSDGVSLTGPGDSRITVRYAECSLMNVYPDGGRHLIGHDGFTLAVEPALHGITAAELAPLDAGVPPTAVVRMPPRDPDRIPRPGTAAAERPTPPAARPRAPRSGALTAVLWILGVLTAGMGMLAVILTFAEFDTSISPEGPVWSELGAFWFLTACFGVPWGICLRRRVRGLG